MVLAELQWKRKSKTSETKTEEAHCSTDKDTENPQKFTGGILQQHSLIWNWKSRLIPEGEGTGSSAQLTLGLPMKDLLLHNGEIGLPLDGKSPGMLKCYLVVFNFILPLSDLFSFCLGPMQDYCVLLVYYYGCIPLKQLCLLQARVYETQRQSTSDVPSE